MARMTQRALEKRREYYRNWRRTHKEQVNATLARYWDKKARQDQEAKIDSEAGQQLPPAPHAAAGRG